MIVRKRKEEAREEQGEEEREKGNEEPLQKKNKTIPRNARNDS